MKKSSLLKILTAMLVIILIVNMALLALKKISEFWFWAVIVAAAVFAYWVLPRISK